MDVEVTTEAVTAELVVVPPQRKTVHYAFDEIHRMAIAISRGGIFGVQNVDQAISLMLLAQAEGLHPATAARDYHIIKGKASKTADAMLASFHAAGGSVEWNELTDTRCCATFTHPQTCPKGLVLDWDIDRAKRAGLAGKDNWNNYPRAMLRARVVSEAIKAVFPAALSGLYTPEEVGDFDEPAPPQVQQVQDTPAALPPPAPAPRPPVRKDPLPVGDAITVSISDGIQQATKTGVAYVWTAEVDGKQNRIWCWHKNKPIEATGQDNPEKYCGLVDVVLKEEGGDKPYYSVEDMYRHFEPPLDMDSTEEVK